MEYTSYEIFPFDKVKLGSNIVIYGAGSVGKHYINQLLSLEYCNIKCVIDKKHAGTNYKTIPVDYPENVGNYIGCTFVIAIASIAAAQEVRELLLSSGINSNDIISGVRNATVSINNRIVVANNSEINQPLCRRGKEYGIIEFNKLKQMWELICTYKPRNYEYVRIGNVNDGGYVMVDDLSDSSIAYSFGINTDVTWDADMANRGYNVFMYDHTIDSLPHERNEFHFFKKGIADSEDHISDVECLENLINDNDHMNKDNMILKMDVEGAEWGFIKLTSEEIFNKFRQCVFEFHNLLDMDKYEYYMECLKKLNKIFIPVHIHANNYGDVIYNATKAYPDAIEVTYLNRKYYNDVVVRNNNMHKLDAPCNLMMDEILI